MQHLILDIWTSFRSLPGWVQIWVALILVPVNMAAIFFVGAPAGWIVAALAVGGMMPNLALMLAQRGWSKAMALSHIVLWTPLVVIIAIWLLPDAIVQGGYRSFLWVLLVVNLISLAFDFVDSVKWWRGDRDIARAV